MSEYNYHMEALRKARIQERARDAKQRQESAASSKPRRPVATRTVSSSYCDKPRLSSYERESTARGVRTQYDEAADAKMQWHYIQKALRDKEKVLRNSNMYMGPMSAFVEQPENHRMSKCN